MPKTFLVRFVRGALLLAALILLLDRGAAADDPPPPSKTSQVGNTVTNPITNLPTTVSALMKDPAGTPTAGDTAFVRTADGYAFLVKGAGEIIYNNDTPPLGFIIVSVDSVTRTAQLDAEPAGGPTAPLSTGLLFQDLEAQMLGSGTEDEPVPPITEAGINGVREVYPGTKGGDGSDGALFVPPTDGKDGKPGPDVTYTNVTTVNATTRHGLEVGSIGGQGGKGGDSYASFWDGRRGGNAGAGGTVNASNAQGVQVATQGANHYGIFAYSRSGQAGNGGSGYGAPGGGSGGSSANGGNVFFTNNGNVSTTGSGSYGIYGLSVSNRGGNGGSQWGLVGGGGDGGYGGNGGSVSITNSATGTVFTSGLLSHGILAQSIGGSGGSAGTSGNLLLSLGGSGDNGGNASPVSVTNRGSITTTGNYSRGIFAQSIGGGGGSGSTSVGLFALGGSGSYGGNASTASVYNYGTITTTGVQSDGIFAQSVGGSGGSGSSGGGLVALGGNGAQGGTGAAVRVENYGTIQTSGDSARGIVAQSVGGGGGDGGFAGGAIAIGGRAGGGGNSSTVTVIHGGTITTEGTDATGIFAQSVGGGGGNGGSTGSVGAFIGAAVGGSGGSGGTGGAVNLTLQGQDANTASLIRTEGDRSMGIFAQSVGGGGGAGGGAVQITGGVGAAVSVAIGGSGGSGGAGGAVTLSKGTGLSIIETGGANSHGVFLQSVGGGGGNGGYSVGVALSGGPVSGSVSVSLGGSGSSGGTGGPVTVGSFDGSGNYVASGFRGSILTTGERSSGFIAQSVGGGGGNGGLAVGVAGSGSLFFDGSVGISLGGGAGSGNSGGTVSVGYEGHITTQGSLSTGLLVQSVGGGGGNGGGAVAAALSGSGGGAAAVTVGLGGSGGSGGIGGTVRAATRNGTVTTGGEHSTGILIQSVGGGGGNGGFSVAGSAAGAGIGAGGVSVGLGGSGGSGGNAGLVNADLQSNVVTSGESSTGILVQSVGGGGGNGGMNISVAGAGAGVGSGAISVGLGGTGASGGTGNHVNATSTGTITTTGDRSSGFVAQSVGGGGGNGGFNISGAGSGAGVGSGGVSVGLGGSAGAGNNAGNVTATTSGDVFTQGAQSLGILAQSVGGGGGNGGFNISASGSGAGVGSGAVSVGLGGSGAGGGNAGTVDLTVTNNVTTIGNASTAIAAQSIGGGGGNGGFNVAASGSGAGVGSGAVSVGLGGSGGSGGNAATATATVTGTVATQGNQSDGILVQSIGGGGGNGGFNVTASGSGAGVGSGAISVGIGASGGDGGNASAATLTATGDVTTIGAEARGVVVQSIGGGGGNGGLTVDASGSGAGVGSGAISVSVGGSGGDGGVSGAVTADVTGNITTNGANSEGFIAQSIGGGGGNGALNVTGAGSGAGVGSGAVAVSVGSSGGAGGDANVVTANYVGDLITRGNYSTGFLAQAVGGGGGNAGGTIAAAGSGAGVGSGSVSVGIGGSGGAAGHGGLAGVDLAVTATASGSIDTAGQFSSGFVAQSIGGGGGNGGYTISANGSGAGVGSGAVAVGIGGSGAKGGDGKDVIANVSSTIRTRESDSIGMLVQSVGGGGGNGGFSVTAAGSGAGTGSGGVSVGLGGGGDEGGRAGDVNATSTGRIQTDKDRSAGFVAQSIGGGGGNGGFNVTVGGSGAGTGSGAVAVGLGGSGGGGGDAGAVTASTSAEIVTLGDMSTGILAQSVGGGGGNGGFNVNVSGSGAGTGSGAVAVGLGGSAAGGGDASTVDLTVNNRVETAGSHSGAVIAQSIGGGGGTGGFNVNVTGSGAGTGSGAVGVGLGGSGGGGGNAAAVTSTMTGDISTWGENSTGLLVQSVGGGGGSGGFNVSAAISGAGTGSGAASVGLGGSGGDGGTAAAVTSSLTGDVTTRGHSATGVTAQSIGGGGGSGGFNVSGTVSAAKTGSGGASVGLGGSGGGGGISGIVDNTVIGDVTTLGSSAGGVLAQSVGGGGGSGSFNVSGTISAAQTGSGAVSVGLGGSGGDGGNSASVTNRVTGNVFTTGTDAFGILAQSVGGGGGNGGMNISGTISAAKDGAGAVGVGIGGVGGGGGHADGVSNTVSGYVQTTGARAAGITTQSLGGGGGNGGLNVTGTITGAKTGSGGISVGVGGFGGDGGNAASATSTITGGVLTMGDQSAGVLTQSLGGGGGNGGLNVSASVNLSKENGGTLGVGVGGFGGGGGNAGDVTSTVTMTSALPQILTRGRESSAVVAQSIGGGGGNGGINVTGAVNLSGKSGAAIGVGVGGFGGGAGNAGKVALTTTGDLFTFGNDSHGLLAQSIGGGGGNGGLNVSGTLSILKPTGGGSGTTVAASIGVGGFGGGGGQAGDVTVNYQGTIVAVPRTLLTPAITDGNGQVIVPAVYDINTTEGAHGLAAQSIGGSGGNGAVNISGALSYGAGEADGHALLIGVGGFGGAGGDAGAVGVNASGTSITAYGDGKSAILASSVGGGGGDGGLNVSGGIVSDSPIIVGIGGMGGNGGTGGDVTVTAANDLYTSAQASNTTNGAGLMAQSIGGGGGNGGLNVSGGISLGKEANVPSITFGIGGFGGAGAVSGDVTASHTGNIATSGGWTHGVFAQSIAGGGGNGALNVSGELNWADSANSGGTKDLTIVAGLGGHGGAGADAGNVNVTTLGGTITTAGDYARGIFAQSVGGGGGTGGMNVTGVFAKNSSPVMLGVGGFGSGGGNAGSVSVTRGTNETAAAKITTDGIGAVGIEASSIGGGGGDAGMNFMVGISLAGSGSGGSGDGSGGGSTTRQHPKNTGVDESVFTNYDKVLDELEGKSKPDSESSTDASKGAAFAAQIAIGGAGGDAGSGGTASIDNHSSVETKKDFSHGIMAQSIGGGGGNATLNIGVVYEGKSDKNKGFNLAVGGGPGDAGDGGAVTVNHTGTVDTSGKGSYGVLAQSIGGGGGNVGLDLAYSKTSGGKVGITIGRIGGEGGSAGDVSLTSDGTITTRGSASYGLIAQSVGNGGGNSSATSVAITIPEQGETPERAGSIAVGMEGGQGGYAGNVTLSAAGAVTTMGEDSHAIFAQSIGGGGGNGGSATGAAVLSSTAAIAVGGTGGQGGTGGTVDVFSSAQVRTNNDRSVGILAQSIGGAGGNGGMSRAGGLQSKGSSVLIAVGGSGGSGMSSGAVGVTNTGVIITDGTDSHGVLAQSIGGGGGNAAMTINSITNRDAADATQLGVSVGGSGGSGGFSGNVTVTNSGGIGTSKTNSAGIFAQAVGGGGGNANKVITGAVSTQGAGNKISIGIGGSGGDGGAAGNVSVSNLADGRIITLNHYAPGILAMSVGGGGGTGSTTITSNRSNGVTQDTKSTSVAFSLGGIGGDGGTGGTVDVVNAGAITTYGYKSHGIVAQSVGGGGGSGGMSISGDLSLGGTSSQSPDAKKSTIAIGGFGGDGNTGGNVTVSNSGSILVHGDNAYGIYAQSVGGGGGDGGFAAALSRNVLANPKTDLTASLLNIGVGGSGGSGGDAGDVVVNHSGSITSHGDNAYGIFAQSVGGGGGSVGASISSPVWTAVDFGISNLLGARDGSNGTAGTVTVNTTGTINMFGANSQAQFTQAVSGGGGDVELFLDFSRTALSLGEGGFVLPNNDGILEQLSGLIDLGAEKLNDAIGSAIDASHIGDLYTWGEKSIASLVQSLGGGGGNADTTVVLDEGAKIDLEIALGAKHTNNSSGGDITLQRTGDVQSAGNGSQGVSVQSVGGGGGRVMLDVRSVPEAHVTSPGVSTSTAVVGLGADPSYDNHGGNLDLGLSGNTVTLGNYSPGLVLQSIGAGGGQAFLNGLMHTTVNIGAEDGSTGNGGSIQLANTGAIATFGERSDGIVLQSIGGGGGYVITDLDARNVTVNARGYNAGHGGSITFTQVGDIVVTGDGSRGVVAQSIGGGGGLVDGLFRGTAGGFGRGGSITLTFEGNVVATGAGGTAIFTESDGNAGGNIDITLAQGLTVMGGEGGMGVFMGGGATNTLLNRGLLTTTAGIDGLAIGGTTGDDRIENYGALVGSIDLGVGANALTNHADAWFSTGIDLNLGEGTLTNLGTLDFGGRSLQTTNVTGNFVQRGRPTWLVDIGDAGHSDGLFVSGRADLGDSVTTVDLFSNGAPRGSGTYTLFTTAGGLGGAQFHLGTLYGEMPIGQTFTLGRSDTALELDLQPSTGTFYWNGAVSNAWNDVFVNGRSNWTREPGGEHIYGTPGAASDVIVAGDAITILGADFTVGSLSGTGVVALGGRTFTVGANGTSTTWEGMIGGPGNLIKTGSGAFTLTGANPVDGSTTVGGGQLFVDGWLGGNGIRVQNGALLGGNGVVPAITVGNGGVVAPGRSIGTLIAEGDVTFEAGSILQIETTAKEADLLWAHGSLLGSGATLQVQPGGETRYSPITVYGILGARDAGAGTFSNVVSDAAYLDPSLQFAADGVYLTLRRNDVDFRSAGTRGNGSAVALSLNGLVRTATGAMAAVINSVYDLPNDEAVRALGSMTGVVHQHVALSSFAGAQTFIDVNLARLGQTPAPAVTSMTNPALGLASGSVPGAERQGAWFSGIGGGTRFAAGNGDPAARVEDRGFAFGYDVAVGRHFMIGGSAGDTWPELELDAVNDRSTSRMRHVGGYARYLRGASRLAVLGGTSRGTNTTVRSVSDGHAFAPARSEYDGGTIYSRVEYGHTLALGRTFSVEPQAGFQYARLTIDGFSEEGVGVLNLLAPERRVSSQRSFLGGRAVKTFGRAAGASVELRGAWAHEFNPLESVRMRLLGDDADNPFDLAAPSRDTDTANIGATIGGRLFRHLTFQTSVDGKLGTATRLWTASVGIRAVW